MPVERVIRIAKLDGQAVVTSPLGDRNAVEDEMISLGETLKTSPSSRAVISVDDGSEVLLGPESTMSFLQSQSGAPRIDLFLKRGTAYFILDFERLTAQSGAGAPVQSATILPDTGLVTIHSPNMSCAALEATRTEFLLSVEEESR